MKEFVVDMISRDTLEEYGYSSNVNDETMSQIANVLRNVFRENVLDELPQIADAYNIPKAPKQHYTVSRSYRTLNSMYGDWAESKRIHGKNNAVALFKKWRDEGLNKLKTEGDSFEIICDDEDLFKVTWSGYREQLGISMY